MTKIVYQEENNRKACRTLENTGGSEVFNAIFAVDTLNEKIRRE